MLLATLYFRIKHLFFIHSLCQKKLNTFNLSFDSKSRTSFSLKGEKILAVCFGFGSMKDVSDLPDIESEINKLNKLDSEKVNYLFSGYPSINIMQLLATEG